MTALPDKTQEKEERKDVLWRAPKDLAEWLKVHAAAKGWTRNDALTFIVSEFRRENEPKKPKK